MAETERSFEFVKLPEEVKERIVNFNKSKKQVEEICSEFERQKKSFYSFMDSFMNNFWNSSDSREKASSFKFKYKSGFFSVSRIVSTSLKFDAELLEAKLSKKLAKKVIDKTYTITDYSGFVKYLKSIGASPEVVKSFICVNKSVDVKTLDNLSNLGLITKNDIKGCYTINKKPAYYKVSFTNEKDEAAKQNKKP